VNVILNPTTPRKIGVIIPSYRRPDFARMAVLQWATQTVKPDVIAIHQNGNAERFDWAVTDLGRLARIEWIHTPQKIPQHYWYSIPLKHLVAAGCTHFFWADHDDIYLSNHIEQCLQDLEDFDFSIALRCGILYVKNDDYRFLPNRTFPSHAPGGMSSSMCFNLPFAKGLISDIEQCGKDHYYTDNIVAKVTMPRFRSKISDARQTTVYVAHPGSQTSATWIDDVFTKLRN
jgi:hypothetical protein